MPDRVDEFFAYARERESIRIRREQQGQKPPWTDDLVLQRYRFCNVFREDDATTRWFRLHVRGPMKDRHDVIFATMCFRMFNRAQTGQVLLEERLFTDWGARIRLPETRARLLALKPLVTGAYMMKTPANMNKLDGTIYIINQFWRDRCKLFTFFSASRHGSKSLQEAHAHLMQYEYIGSFHAYEFVTDLAHTWALEGAPDIYHWASPGPGAKRGIYRVFGEYTNDQDKQLKYMRHLLLCSAEHKYWPQNWRQWTMREVEHTLCEFDKYDRTKQGQGRPKQLFRSGQ